MGENEIGTTSFIPKRPIAVGRGTASATGAGVLLFLSAILLLSSVALYFWAVYQDSSKVSQISVAESNLNKAQAQFEPNQIVNMTRFDAKLKAADALLLNNHTTILPLLDIISAKTLQSVRFRDFKYTNVDNQKISIKMNGETKTSAGTANYSAVAQQARELVDTRMFSNVIVSDLNLGPTGNVVFALSADIKPELISYASAVNQ